jgi:hypothetical protein
MSGDGGRSWLDSDYIDVAERLRQFYERYPDGRLITEPPWVMEIAGKPFICCRVGAYRDPEDPMPSIGLAWEPVPGPTPFTKDSELMNAQTAAWGRAIVAVGFATKKIASAEEVRNRSSGEEATGAGSSSPDDSPEQLGDDVRPEQRRRMSELLRDLHKADREINWEEIAKAYMGKEFNAANSSQLTYDQFEILLMHLGNKLIAITPTEGFETSGKPAS